MSEQADANIPRSRIPRRKKVFVASRRALLLVAATFINAITPLAVIPVVSRVGGSEAWAAMAVGTSCGLVASLVVMWGWATHGPVLAANARSSVELSDLIRGSFLSRLVLLFPAAVAGAVLAWIASPSDKGFAVAVSLAMAMSGLSFAWFFVGTGSPLQLVLLDSLPRLLASLAAAGIIVSTGMIMSYPVLQISASMFACSAVVYRQIGGGRIFCEPLATASRGLRLTGPAGIGQVFSGVYINGSVAIVALANASAVSEFSSINRVYIAGLTITAPVLQFAVAYVGGRNFGFVRRVRWSICVQVALAAVVCVITVLFFQIALDVLFGHGVTVSEYQGVAVGLAVAVVMVSRAVGSHLLLAYHRAYGYSLSAILGAALGSVLIPVAAIVSGSSGAMNAILCTEIVVLTVQLLVAAQCGKSGRKVRLMGHRAGQVGQEVKKVGSVE